MLARDIDLTFYVNGGLHYKPGYLKSVYPSVLHFPRADQAEFADAIVRRFATNTEFCWLLMVAPECALEELAQQTDGGADITTAIGNAAYMAEHCLPYFQPNYERQYEDMMAYFAVTPRLGMGGVDRSQKIHWLHRLCSTAVCAVSNPVRRLLSRAHSELYTLSGR